MLLKLFFNPAALILLTALAIVFSFSLYHSTKKTQQSSQQLESLEAEIEEMEQQVAVLEEATKEAEQPFVKEKIIRDELLMQKPGEYVVQIPDITESDATLTQTPQPSPWDEWKVLLLRRN